MEKYSEEDIIRIVEWMNQCREVMGFKPDIDEAFLRRYANVNHKQCSCGGFTFIKTKRGIHIKVELSKILVSNDWRKNRRKKNRKPNEIQENFAGSYKCVRCEKERSNKVGFYNRPSYVTNGKQCKICGYKRPTDKEIIKLWNEQKSLEEMCKILDEPVTTYIKSRLKKYGLYERIGWQWHNAFNNDQIYSAYVWERINQDKFPLKS